MADNYLEGKFEALRERREKEEKRRRAAWKKRMDAYRKSLADKQQVAVEPSPQTEGVASDRSEPLPDHGIGSPDETV